MLFRPAFHGALERIAKQLRRYKRRLTNHHKGHGHNDALSALQYVIEPENEDEEMSKDAQPAIIAEMATEVATLSVSKAVMRMRPGRRAGGDVPKQGERWIERGVPASGRQLRLDRPGQYGRTDRFEFIRSAP